MRPRLSQTLAVTVLLCAALLVPDPALASGDEPIRDMPDSSTLSSAVLARGRLLDAGGRPAAGVVRLYG